MVFMSAVCVPHHKCSEDYYTLIKFPSQEGARLAVWLQGCVNEAD